MKITKITPLIFHISSKTTEEIAKSFVRFQEYYENPIFKNKNSGFSVDDIDNWWKDKNPETNYYNYWSGFNVPGKYFLNVLRNANFHPFNQHELNLINLLKDIPITKLNNGILIGSGDDKDDVLNHELAHAYYYTDKSYKKMVDSLIDGMSPTMRFKLGNSLQNMGYHKTVINDEIQAYLSTYTDTLSITFSDILDEDSAKIHSKYFKLNFNKYINE